MSDALLAETITITSRNGDKIEAYSARALDDAARGGVVVLHHLPGYDDGTKEIARRLAYCGYNAVVPNLYWRQAPSRRARRCRGDRPDPLRHPGPAAGRRRRRRPGLPQGPAQLERQGGHHRLLLWWPPVHILAAVSLDLDAAVDCYGSYVAGTLPASYPLKVSTLVDRTMSLSCPLLGIFGAPDARPDPAEVDELAGRAQGGREDVWSSTATPARRPRVLLRPPSRLQR